MRWGDATTCLQDVVLIKEIDQQSEAAPKKSFEEWSYIQYNDLI